MSLKSWEQTLAPLSGLLVPCEKENTYQSFSSNCTQRTHFINPYPTQIWPIIYNRIMFITSVVLQSQICYAFFVSVQLNVHYLAPGTHGDYMRTIFTCQSSPSLCHTGNQFSTLHSKATKSKTPVNYTGEQFLDLLRRHKDEKIRIPEFKQIRFCSWMKIRFQLISCKKKSNISKHF